MAVDDTKPPKIKRFAIIATHNDTHVACLYFNTNSNSALPVYIRSLHLSVQKNQMPNVLEHDCFLSCDYISEKLIENLKNEYLGDSTIYLGKIPDSVLEVAKQLVVSAKTIETRLKKKYHLIP